MKNCKIYNSKNIKIYFPLHRLMHISSFNIHPILESHMTRKLVCKYFSKKKDI